MSKGFFHATLTDASTRPRGNYKCTRPAATQGLISARASELHSEGPGTARCDFSEGDCPPHGTSLIQTKGSNRRAARSVGESHLPYTLTLYLPKTGPIADLAGNCSALEPQAPPKPVQPQFSEDQVVSCNFDCPALEVDSGHSDPWPLPPPSAGGHNPDPQPRGRPEGPVGSGLRDGRTRRDQTCVLSSAAVPDEPMGRDLDICASVVKGVVSLNVAKSIGSLEVPVSRWNVLLSSHDVDQCNHLLGKSPKDMDPQVRAPRRAPRPHCDFGPSPSVCTEAESTRRQVTEPYMEHSGLEDVVSVNNNGLSLMSGGMPGTYVRPKPLRKRGLDDVAAASSCGLADQCDAPTENLNSIFFFL